jgi:RNA polymerase sigma-70 factor (ECF subfamily)
VEFREGLLLALQAGRAAWPDLDVDAASFEAWARSAEVDGETLARRGEDLYLVVACVARQPEALVAFERQFLTGITSKVGRVALTPDQADELRQRLRVTLLVGPDPKIGNFRGQGPLWAWVQVCAVRLALRATADKKHLLVDDTSFLDNVVSRDADQEVLAVKGLYGETFQKALEESFTALAAREKTILRMHFLDGRNIDEIGRVFHVHRATVARWLVAIRQQVLRSLCQKVSLDLETSKSEFSSLFRLVFSDIRLSLLRILGEESAK